MRKGGREGEKERERERKRTEITGKKMKIDIHIFITNEMSCNYSDFQMIPKT